MEYESLNVLWELGVRGVGERVSVSKCVSRLGQEPQNVNRVLGLLEEKANFLLDEAPEPSTLRKPPVAVEFLKEV